MHKISFEESRNKAETCVCDGKYLHSKYSPQTEAERFVSNVQTSFQPVCVVVVEPALSYCAPFLKKRFPNAILVAIRFCDDFSKTDFLWNKVFRFDNRLSQELFDFLGEENLCATLFVDWSASRAIFSKENAKTWEEIKSAVEKARSLILTREYFSRRWLLNTAIFAANIKKTAKICTKNKKTPIVIAASGPSLSSSISAIKKNRENFFLIAVSSAAHALFSEGIFPNIVLSTDGGFWAKKHLERISSKIPLALTAESAAPHSAFSQKIIPLCYDDGADFERKILNRLEIPFIFARRNGTVSGTALELALNLTDGDIFFAGLDQESSAGFQHKMPNSLEYLNETADFRLSPKENRITSSRFSSEGSLAIYRDWFSNKSKKIANRTFRIASKNPFKNSLGEIRDIDVNEFLKKTNGTKNEIMVEDSGEIKTENRKKIFLEEFSKARKDKSFLFEIFPTDSILYKRESDENRRREILQKIDEKAKDLEERIMRPFLKR